MSEAGRFNREFTDDDLKKVAEFVSSDLREAVVSLRGAVDSLRLSVSSPPRRGVDMAAGAVASIPPVGAVGSVPLAGLAASLRSAIVSLRGAAVSLRGASVSARGVTASLRDVQSELRDTIASTRRGPEKPPATAK